MTMCIVMRRPKGMGEVWVDVGNATLPTAKVCAESLMACRPGKYPKGTTWSYSVHTAASVDAVRFVDEMETRDD